MYAELGKLPLGIHSLKCRASVGRLSGKELWSGSIEIVVRIVKDLDEVLLPNADDDVAKLVKEGLRLHTTNSVDSHPCLELDRKRLPEYLVICARVEILRGGAVLACGMLEPRVATRKTSEIGMFLDCDIPVGADDIMVRLTSVKSGALLEWNARQRWNGVLEFKTSF